MLPQENIWNLGPLRLLLGPQKGFYTTLTTCTYELMLLSLLVVSYFCHNNNINLCEFWGGNWLWGVGNPSAPPPLYETLQVILPSQRRVLVLLAHCLQSSVWIVRLGPVMLYLQVGPCVSSQAHLVDCCSFVDCSMYSTMSCVLAVATIISFVRSVRKLCWTLY